MRRSSTRPAITRRTFSSSAMRFDCVCRRPAVSTIATSCPRARAASTASKATAAGSAPRGEPTKSAPARSAQISSCSSAAARNVSAAPTSTERPCSRSFWASLPIVVVFPVPLTPTTRIDAGLAIERERGRLAEDRLDLLGERILETAGDAARLEPPHELRGRGHAYVAADQRLLEPLPGLVVPGVECRRGELLGVRARRLFASDSRTRAKTPVRSGSSASSPRRREVRPSCGSRGSLGACGVAGLWGTEVPCASDGGRRGGPRVPTAETSPRAFRKQPAHGQTWFRPCRSPRRCCCAIFGSRARHDLRHAVGPHRHAVEDIRGLHRPLLVGDDDELRAVGVAAKQLHEARDVRVVERGLDLVEEVEGAGPREEEREEERDRAERLLPSGKQREPRDPLAGRAEARPRLRARRPPPRARRAEAGPRLPERASPATSSKCSATAANVSAKRRSTVSASSARSFSSSSRLRSRSSRCACRSVSRSFSASYSSRASGFTCPSAARRDLQPLGPRRELVAVVAFGGLDDAGRLEPPRRVCHRRRRAERSRPLRP